MAGSAPIRSGHAFAVDVEARYFDEKAGRCQLGLYVNGVLKGSPWRASNDSGEWTTHTISGVTIGSGDEIMVEVKADAGEHGKLDYVQLNYKGASSDTPALAKSRFSASGPLDDPAALPGHWDSP